MFKIRFPKDVPSATPPPCRLARQALWGESRETGLRRFRLESRWIQNHVAQCPRCQRRFAAQGKVSLGLQLARSQAHGPTLLSHANKQVLKMLQRGVRQSPEAVQLQSAYPHPRVWERLGAYRGALRQMAACIALMALGKIGLLGSMQQAQDRTEDAMRTYYTEHLDPSMVEDVFPG